MFDLLFPPYCIGCGKPGKYLCSECQKRLKNSLPECYICRRLSSRYITHSKCNKYGIDALFFGWEYNNVAKKILTQYKYRYAYNLAEILSRLLIIRLEETGFVNLIERNSLLVPIPSHRVHIQKRGFNQSTLIGEFLSTHLNIPLEKDILKRVGSSDYQANLELRDRKNLGDVFTLKSKIKEKNIILLDDVVTSGTTLNRAAMSFTDKDIKAIALFRGRPHYSQT
jgi:ComF family protein